MGTSAVDKRMHRVRDLDPSCGCGHVQISSVATWGGTWHAAGTSPHTRRSALLHRASVRCLSVIASSQLPFETCSLYKTSPVTGVPRAGLLRNPLCTPQPLLLLLMTLWWGWSDDRWLCITPDQCSGRVTSLFVSTVKTGALNLFLRWIWILFLMLCLSRIRIFNSY